MAQDIPEELSRINRRLVDSSARIRQEPPEEITYQHTVLCQTCLPYRNPGSQVREWKRTQGAVKLLLEAGQAIDPKTGDFVKLSLPFGSKVRLVLMHLNAEAIKTQTPTVEVERSLTAFVKRLGLAAHGRDIKAVKDQLSCLSAATLRLAIANEERVIQVNTQFISTFDLWFPKDERQRVLWPSTVRLNEDYFRSLAKHAVPLDERAIAALSHSAMALDLYSWLAQRLHRVNPHEPQLVSWQGIKDQFGFSYARMIDFRRVFLRALAQTHMQYRGAKIGFDDQGLTLHHSPPPIKGRIATVPRRSKKAT